MSEWKIYHNPRCSKSRATLEILTEAGVQPEVVEYLQSPPSVSTLTSLLSKLNKEVLEIVRTKEAKFQELELEGASSEKLLTAISENPVLLERPIVERGDRAVIGRPPENVNDLL